MISKKIISLTFSLISFCSCAVTCQDVEQEFKQKYEWHMILKSKEVKYMVTYLKGIDLQTHKDTSVEDGSKEVIIYYNRFLLGDTIIKKRGESTMYIRRKGFRDTILYPTCEPR